MEDQTGGTEDRKVLTSRNINTRKGFLQGDSYSPAGFCLMEVPVSVWRRLMDLQWDREIKKE